jgi:hypothetical protein
LNDQHRKKRRWSIIISDTTASFFAESRHVTSAGDLLLKRPLISIVLKVTVTNGQRQIEEIILQTLLLVTVTFTSDRTKSIIFITKFLRLQSHKARYKVEVRLARGVTWKATCFFELVFSRRSFPRYYERSTRDDHFRGVRSRDHRQLYKRNTDKISRSHLTVKASNLLCNFPL